MNGIDVGAFFQWGLAALATTAAVAGGYTFLRRCGASATDRYWFLRLGIVAMLSLPCLDLGSWLKTEKVVAMRVAPAMVVAGNSASPVAPAPAAPWWPLAVIGVYLAVAGVLLARVAFAWLKAEGRVRRAVPERLYRGIAVLRHDWAEPPAVFGVVRPRILIPGACWDELSQAERHLILAHESVHALRRDPLTLLAAALVRALLWFSPFVHFVWRKIHEDMEFSCDEVVLAGGSAAAAVDTKAYGKVLFDVAMRFNIDAAPLGAGIRAARSTLARRLSMLNGTRTRKTGMMAAVAAAVLLASAASSSFARDYERVREVHTSLLRGKAGDLQFHVRIANRSSDGKHRNSSDVIIGVADGEERRVMKWPDESAAWLTAHNLDTGVVRLNFKVTGPKGETLQDSQITIERYKAANFSFSDSDTRVEWHASIEHLAPRDVDADGRLLVDNPFPVPTPVRDTVKKMARLTGRSIILSRDIEGDVAIKSDARIPLYKLDSAYDAALNAIGAKLIQDRGRFRIVRKDSPLDEEVQPW